MKSPYFKKSWLEGTFKPVNEESDESHIKEEANFVYPPKDNDSTMQTSDQQMLDHLPNINPMIKASFHQYIQELADEQDEAEKKKSGGFEEEKSGITANKRKESYEDFNLESDVRNNIVHWEAFTDADRRKYLGILNYKIKKLGRLNKPESIKRYLDKKKRRKFVCQIKYKIRQDLACKRMRNKGKFVKSSKMDLITAANMLLTSFLTRRSRKEATK